MGSVFVEPPAMGSPGRVTVKVTPWAEVIYEGRNYGVTPVASITMCVQPSADSHSDKAIRPLVVV